MFLSADARALLAAEAVVKDAAVPATGFRHLRVDHEPLVVVPLGMAGEDSAPLAFGVGHDRDDMELIAIPEPRNRDEAWAGLERFATRICDWLDAIAADRVTVNRGKREVSMSAKPAQLVLPAPASTVLLRKLAHVMVWAPEEAPPILRRAGGWLLYFADRHEIVPGDSALLVATEAIATHWVLPLSGPETGHLLAVMAALDAEQGAIAAARSVEDEPGGALTAPTFDKRTLQPLIETYNDAKKAGESKAIVDAARAVADALAPKVRRLYDASLDALERLRELPPIPPVITRRAEEECEALVRHADYLASIGLFARADSL